MVNEHEDEEIKAVSSLVGKYFKEGIVKVLEPSSCDYAQKGGLSQDYECASENLGAIESEFDRIEYIHLNY